MRGGDLRLQGLSLPTPSTFRTTPTSFFIVLQGTDLYDGLELSEAEISLYHFVYLQLTMIDHENNIIMTYSSNTSPYSTGCIDFHEEEFLFENVFQTNSIRVALFASKGSGKKNISLLGGEVTIPMNRLEENIPVCHIPLSSCVIVDQVVQWYQLSSLSSTRYIKTSIKFEVALLITSFGLIYGGLFLL
jgi:hypothetical protein